jgi:cystathionine gamma-synthase
MPAFTHLPLGQRIPDTPHGVSCSLPTMRAVRGYEEKDPEITAHLTSGYPRFLVHPYLQRLAAHYAAEPGLAGRHLWLVTSARLAAELADHLGPGAEAEPFSRNGLHGLAHRDDPESASRAKLFLQHVGGFLSSREAEDRLVGLGLLPRAHPEAAFTGDAAAEIRRRLAPLLPGADPAGLGLAPSGMNAFYAAFRAVSEVQAERGRTVWIQLGWLYLDTIEILRKFTARPEDHVRLPDALDLAGLRRLLASIGPRVAGLVTEVPTNPLIQTPDVAALAALCREHGVRLVLDPSVASPFSVEVFPHADVLVASLTKYAASDGDVIAGLAAVNPAGPDAARIAPRLAARLEPCYSRDLARLAAQIGRAEAVLARIEASAPRVASFLAAHPRVGRVYWALQPASREHYLRVARRPGACGGMITFTLRGPLEPFYDRLRLPKGPSFGMTTTLICPFLYLAHYELVRSPEGRAELAAAGLEPDLLRLCVGAEPAEEIIAALAEALG